MSIKLTRQKPNTAVYTVLVTITRPSFCLQCGVSQFYCFCGGFEICRMFIVKCEGWSVGGQGLSQYSAAGKRISCK
jgi:hypothetical protein